MYIGILCILILFRRKIFFFICLRMKEDEWSKIQPLNVEWLMMDSNILLPPMGTPMTGI